MSDDPKKMTGTVEDVTGAIGRALTRKLPDNFRFSLVVIDVETGQVMHVGDAGRELSLQMAQDLIRRLNAS